MDAPLSSNSLRSGMMYYGMIMIVDGGSILRTTQKDTLWKGGDIEMLLSIAGNLRTGIKGRPF
jgi:hypothetical protein